MSLQTFTDGCQSLDNIVQGGQERDDKVLLIDKKLWSCIQRTNNVANADNLGLCKNTPLNNTTAYVNQWVLPQWI